MQTKRKVILNSYDTAVDGLWTLAACELSDAEVVTNYIDVPGRLDGPLDASTVLTGDVTYKPRTLSLQLESSEGTRQEREARIDYMVNKLHGQRVKIWLPDDAAHYLVGRISVKKEYNNLAHAAVTVSAVCEPWRYENEETFGSALLCGKNLLDNQNLHPVIHNYGSAETIDTGVRSVNTRGSTWAYVLLRVLPIEVLAGKTITVNYTATASGANTPRFALGYCSADGEVRAQTHTSLAYTDTVTMLVEARFLADCDYVGIWLYSNHTGTAVEGDYIDYTNLQVEVGTEATEYEAYEAGASSPQEVILTNARRPAIPLLTVQGEVRLEYDDSSYALSEGTYQLPAIQLRQEEHTVKVSGTGTVTFTYRKAVL